MANTFEYEPNTSVTNCTCGHNYAVNQRNDDPAQVGDHQQHHSASSNQEGHDGVCSNTTIDISLPLDTSFVQIPMMRTIPINNNTQRGNLNQMLHHSSGNSTSDPAENDKNFDTDQRSSCCNLNYTECVTKLYQAVSSTTDSVPSLCQQCVKRYDIFARNIDYGF